MEEKRKKLQELRTKWTGKIPNINDKNYWEFRCDRTQAIKLKRIIEKFDAEEDMVLKIFS